MKLAFQFDNSYEQMTALSSRKLDKVPYFTCRKLEQIATSVLFGTVHPQPP